MLIRTAPILTLFALPFAACSSESKNEDASNMDNSEQMYTDTGSGGYDAETDADTDSDTDTDSDADTDLDTDIEGDTAEPDDPEDTGDTAEPQEECDDESDVTLYISPDDSNSMSSPVQVRSRIESGYNSLSGVSIRTFEFMNYYHFDYAPAELGEVAIDPQMVLNDDGTYTLQIGVTSPRVTPADRDPMNITLVLDESGSMSGQPINLVEDVCEEVVGQLKDGDVISMVTWDTSNAVRLDSRLVSGPDDTVALNACGDISAGGGTNLSGGLEAGYTLASANYDVERINRILLMSDGGANAGETDKEIIAQYAGDQDSDGIYMVGVGVGSGNSYNDALMDTVTDVGRGASVFIPDEIEVSKVFGDRFVNTLDVAARDVQVRLDLPPGFEIVKFSGEEYSSDPTEIEPQHLAPNDSMVFFQTLETCAPEDITSDTQIEITVTYKDPITFVEHQAHATVTFADLLDGDTALLKKGEAVYTYAESLKTYKAAATSKEKSAAINEALSVLATAETANPGDSDLAEIRSVLETF